MGCHDINSSYSVVFNKHMYWYVFTLLNCKVIHRLLFFGGWDAGSYLLCPTLCIFSFKTFVCDAWASMGSWPICAPCGCVGTAVLGSVWVCLRVSDCRRWAFDRTWSGVPPLLVQRKLEWKLLESAGSIMSFCGRTFSWPIKCWSPRGHIWRQHIQEQDIRVVWWIYLRVLPLLQVQQMLNLLITCNTTK